MGYGLSLLQPKIEGITVGRAQTLTKAKAHGQTQAQTQT